jgi:hypothetical protein
VGFDPFSEFVTTRPTEGLGTSMGMVRRIVADDPEVLDLLDQAEQRPPALHNVQGTEAPTGNNPEAALRRQAEALRMVFQGQRDGVERARELAAFRLKADRKAGQMLECLGRARPIDSASRRPDGALTVSEHASDTASEYTRTLEEHGINPRTAASPQRTSAAAW